MNLEKSRNHALLRTAPRVTLAAWGLHLAPLRQPARRAPQSLSLRSFGGFPMHLLLITLLGVLTCTAAHAELYLQSESYSPDGAVVFAINYPPTEKHPEGYAQGCFVHPKSEKRIGEFFYLPDTGAEGHHPGTYLFDNYNVFDYVWSADSTHIAIVHNMRHFGTIHPFRRAAYHSSLSKCPIWLRC